MEENHYLLFAMEKESAFDERLAEAMKGCYQIFCFDSGDDVRLGTISRSLQPIRKG